MQDSISWQTLKVAEGKYENKIRFVEKAFVNIFKLNIWVLIGKRTVK